MQTFDGSALRHVEFFEPVLIILSIFRNDFIPNLLDKEEEKVQIIRQINHPNIIKITDINRCYERLEIIMEYAKIDFSPFIIDSPKSQQIQQGIKVLAEKSIAYSEFDQNSVLLGLDGFYKIFNFQKAYLYDCNKRITNYHQPVGQFDFKVSNQQGSGLNQFNIEEDDNSFMFEEESYSSFEN